MRELKSHLAAILREVQQWGRQWEAARSQQVEKSSPEQGSNLSMGDSGSPERRNWVLDLLPPLLSHFVVIFFFFFLR